MKESTIQCDRIHIAVVATHSTCDTPASTLNKRRLIRSPSPARFRIRDIGQAWRGDRSCRQHIGRRRVVFGGGGCEDLQATMLAALRTAEREATAGCKRNIRSWANSGARNGSNLP